ncbi:MAG: phosphatidylcholine/phosphatidylserine synthase [Sneathiella sp.]|nr:phosphatidylcholine/phosphatidylserine synthase [Sneathiella sp.]
MSFQQRRKLKLLPLNSLIPNMLTMLALCAGMTSVRFALDEKWEMAVIAILAAGVLDGLDGRMARLLKGTSRFGAELDSLSDFVSFGVAPGLVLFLWTLDSGLGGVGWIIALVFTVSCGLRLARFNSMLDEKQPAWAARYFTGIAAPAGASISLLFMVISFYTDNDFFRSAILNAVWLLFMAFLMASRIPTFSIKRVRIARRFIMPMLVLVGGLAAVLASYPWQLLSAIAVVYMVTIPFSIMSHRRLQGQDTQKADMVKSDDAPEDDDEVGETH